MPAERLGAAPSSENRALALDQGNEPVNSHSFSVKTRPEPARAMLF
jgi:hypothetical protein